MDGRKLDISAPLMSVRRNSAASSSPSLKKESEKSHTFPNHKSDITSLDQITEPVAVPFNWEHIPGMAKDHANKSNSCKIDCDRETEDDDHDVYSDALDTLSSTESLSMNCSASGLSGLDNNLEASKYGTNDTDKQTQDFMMNRFLPAAKAMTFHPPHYASSRKQSVLAEQPRDVIRSVREERKSLVKKHITDIVPYTTGLCQEEDEEELSSDESDEYDNSANNSAKGCGIMFHRLCTRNSLCLLNPVAEMKLKNQISMSCAYEIEKANKNSHTQAIKKAWDAIHKSKSSSGASSPEIHEAREKWTSEMKQQGRVSPFRRSRAAAATTTTTTPAAGASAFQSKPQSLFPRSMLHSNQPGNLRFPSQGQGSKTSSSCRSLAIEKTLYIDNVSTFSDYSCSADKTERVGAIVPVMDTREGKETSSIMTESFQDSKNLTDLDSQVSATAQQDNKDQELQITEFDHTGKVGSELAVVSHLPPPLPKSPSDSWLSRALPLVYMKNNPFLNADQSTLSLSRRHGFNASSRYTKWETIVKSSNLHHGRLSYSQEITIYKPQHSKS